jgi:lipopolysaccharide biosynthesis glycosyltransferase
MSDLRAPLNPNAQAVAFFTDRAMLPGMHVALRSLLLSNRGQGLHIVVFADHLSHSDKLNLLRTHEDVESNNTLAIRDYSPEPLEHANYLRGNATTYGRLYLADLLAGFDRCVYLDADLLIQTSLAPMFALFDGQHLLLADGGKRRAEAQDRKLYENAGLDLDGYCFNAGVLGIDLELWRAMDALTLCKQVAAAYPNQFSSADQAILNVAFHDQFLAFGTRFNCPLYPADPAPAELEERIYHFVGALKPWDPFGKQLHNAYHFWHEIYRETAIGHVAPRQYSSTGKVVRSARQLWKTWLHQFQLQRQ